MAYSQKKFREIVFQMVFSRDLNENLDDKALSSFLDQFLVPKKFLYQAYEKAQSVFDAIEKIDTLIAKFSSSYDFKRISKVEKNVLRLASFELLFKEEVPKKVAISEAIRLSRKFGSPEGSSFVNAVLDGIYKWILSPEFKKESL